MNAHWHEVTLEMPNGDWRYFRMHGTYRDAVLEGLRHEALPESEGALLLSVRVVPEQ